MQVKKNKQKQNTDLEPHSAAVYMCLCCELFKLQCKENHFLHLKFFSCTNRRKFIQPHIFHKTIFAAFSRERRRLSHNLYSKQTMTANDSRTKKFESTETISWGSQNQMSPLYAQ